MKNKLKKILTMVLIGIMIIGTAEAIFTDTIYWDGNGIDSNGVVSDVQCGTTDPYGINQPYLLWILTPGGDPNLVAQNLILDGIGSYPPFKDNGGATQYITPYVQLSGLSAHVTYTSDTTRQVLTISHGCPGTQIPEFPTIALPIAAMIGLVFLFQRRKNKEE